MSWTEQKLCSSPDFWCAVWLAAPTWALKPNWITLGLIRYTQMGSFASLSCLSAWTSHRDQYRSLCSIDFQSHSFLYGSSSLQPAAQIQIPGPQMHYGMDACLGSDHDPVCAAAVMRRRGCLVSEVLLLLPRLVRQHRLVELQPQWSEALKSRCWATQPLSWWTWCFFFFFLFKSCLS